jgi:hypothetical protein
MQCWLELQCIDKMHSPALIPELPAMRSPCFLTMKLDPMKIEELTARASPMDWSDILLVSEPSKGASYVAITVIKLVQRS